MSDPMRSCFACEAAADVKAFRAKSKAAVLERVWTSLGTTSRDQASLWAPLLESSLMRRNRARVCIGFYPVAGFDAPGSPGAAAAMKEKRLKVRVPLRAMVLCSFAS